MTTPNRNSQEVLRNEILAEAKRESEAIVQRARQEAEALLAKAAAEANRVRQERLDQARAESARRKELILATVPVEASRRRLARIEALLESVHEKIRLRLRTRDGFDDHEIVAALAAEAISRMPGDAFVVKLAPADHRAFGKRLAGEIAQRTGRSPLNITLADDPTITDGGVIVQDAEGRQVWDDRLRSRLERLWPELRRQIAVQTSLVVENSPAGGGA